MTWTCSRCHSLSATAYVELFHNVGAVVVRHEGSTTGRLCRSCLRRAFVYHTVINLLFGWWGLISVLITPVFLIGNIFAYRQALRELASLSRPRRPDRD